MTIQTQQDKLNGSMEAFARAFSDVIKDTTSHLATKEDIANMATRQDIANMATKQDIANMATKQDIANMATKQDINGLSDRIDTTNKNMQAQFARQEEKIAEIARKLD